MGVWLKDLVELSLPPSVGQRLRQGQRRLLKGKTKIDTAVWALKPGRLHLKHARPPLHNCHEPKLGLYRMIQESYMERRCPGAPQGMLGCWVLFSVAVVYWRREGAQE